MSGGAPAAAATPADATPAQPVPIARDLPVDPRLLEAGGTPSNPRSGGGIPPDSRGAFGPLLVWLAVQMAAMALAAWRVPLWAKHPPTSDPLAVHVLLSVQIIASALLFPLLLRGFGRALAAIAVTWPMLLGAGAIAAVEPSGLLRAAAFLTVWMAVLAEWARVLTDRRHRLIGVALAGGLTVGEVVLRYLQAEFGSTDELAMAGTPIWTGFLGAAMTPVSGGSISSFSWYLLLTLGGVAVVISLLRWFRTPAGDTSGNG